MDTRIAIEGTDADFESLWDWLQYEPQLRGHVKASHPSPTGGAMGSPVELVIALATSATGTAAIMARALSRWLVERERQRRSDVTVKVSGPDGRQVSVTTRGPAATDTEALLLAAMEAVAQDPATGQAPDDAGLGG